MSVLVLFVVLFLLMLGAWVFAAISLWYGRELLKRQRILTRALLPYLKKMEQDKATMKALQIDKDEPLSKYQNITLPDEIHIDFTRENNA